MPYLKIASKKGYGTKTVKSLHESNSRNITKRMNYTFRFIGAMMNRQKHAECDSGENGNPTKEARIQSSLSVQSFNSGSGHEPGKKVPKPASQRPQVFRLQFCKAFS
ncbi:hypothetical protein ABZP36_003583 [Zizania latifolia]